MNLGNTPSDRLFKTLDESGERVDLYLCDDHFWERYKRGWIDKTSKMAAAKWISYWDKDRDKGWPVQIVDIDQNIRIHDGTLVSRAISDHIDASEIACKTCKVVHALPHPDVVKVFEKLRSNLGNRPIAVLDGCRCSKRQDAVIGKKAKVTPHVPRFMGRGVAFFFALDIDIPARTGLDREGMRDKIRSISSDVRIGWEAYTGQSFVHFDVAYLAETFLSRSDTTARVRRAWVRGMEW